MSRVQIVLPDGVAERVKAAIDANTGGLRDTIRGLAGNTVTVVQNPDGTWPGVTGRRAWLVYRWVVRDATKMPTAADGRQAGDLVSVSDGILT